MVVSGRCGDEYVFELRCNDPHVIQLQAFILRSIPERFFGFFGLPGSNAHMQSIPKSLDIFDLR
jgi:hypothetical protein